MSDCLWQRGQLRKSQDPTSTVWVVAASKPHHRHVTVASGIDPPRTRTSPKSADSRTHRLGAPGAAREGCRPGGGPWTDRPATLRPVARRQAALTFEPTLLKRLDALRPRKAMAAMHTTAMRATRRAYSTSDAPRS